MILGPCPTCGKMFQSRDRKIFCSLACYHQSAQFKAMMDERKEKQKNREDRTCPVCGKVFEVKVSSKKQRCSKLCYRKNFAERHDRWVANPQTIALPQNYDEFLSKDELPCIIEGCEWVGNGLSAHINYAHGITAAEFKELAGFNRNSGIISAVLQKLFQDRPYLHLRSPDKKEEMRAHMQKMISAIPVEVIHPEARLEQRERMRKILAERRAEAPEQSFYCKRCGKVSTFRSLGRPPLYCEPCRPLRHEEQRQVRKKGQKT